VSSQGELECSKGELEQSNGEHSKTESLGELERSKEEASAEKDCSAKIPDLGFQKRVETVANLVANDYRTMEVDDGVQTSRLKREHPCEEEQDERVVKLRGASVGEIYKDPVDTTDHGNPRIEEACHQANSSSVADALHTALTEDLALARSAGSQPQKHRQKLENFAAAQNRDWATIHIFCSSTFRDMLGERHVLQTAILPALQVWGRERFIDFSNP